MLFGAACQFATVWITWALWQTRSDPPNLPTFDLPPWSFGWWIVGSLVWVCVRPRSGLAVHWFLLVIAALFDQTRLQPQFFGLALLMTACVWPAGLAVARWFLASTWLWAGLHKLLSPDWFGFASHWLVERMGIDDPDALYLPFALTVAIVELAVGVMACVRPRWAAIACIPMHLGIILMLSPLLAAWNASVIPWNLAMAVIGSWILWSSAGRWILGRWEPLLIAAWMATPLGFFVGWIDHGFAGVLYSDSVPRGLITRHDGLREIVGWGAIGVPFPNERRTLRMYFERSARPGEKLHIADPRWLLEDQYFVLGQDRRAVPIDRPSFFASTPIIAGDPSVLGVAKDSPRSIFRLQQAGVRMLQESLGQPIYAVAFDKQSFRPELMQALPGLPNLQQVQLAGTSVRDQDLVPLAQLHLLAGLGLDNTDVTDRGLETLRDLPYLQHVECENTDISAQALRSLLSKD
ncbi:hypothetical protein FYK55_16545 [Roseiconus nitratireducens]|uniref:Uncharacterized protein n=1 Tax=Roseiconus nitratireducens TaxID=2605748 RepID=A0A5M6D3Q1_9BACT|nr:hypothetical protein FYK55_16545 [Roseiconus nitratireducens]